MSLRLPAKEHPTRELFSMEHLAEIAAPAVRHKLPTLRQAKTNAATVFEASKVPKAVNYIVLRANGDIHLVSFGRKGGFRVRWNFGQ